MWFVQDQRTNIVHTKFQKILDYVLILLTTPHSIVNTIGRTLLDAIDPMAEIRLYRVDSVKQREDAQAVAPRDSTKDASLRASINRDTTSRVAALVATKDEESY